MTFRNLLIKTSGLGLILVLLLNPLVATAQTEVRLPKNKYKIEEDIKLGREAAAEAERDFPILRDPKATQYVERVGQRLVASIPRQFRQPAFNYTFKIINARDINAFALPGGPMYVNRGMIEAARNEGEMAGVMAHEIAHVALRHGTAQATKMNNPWNQVLAIGAILGGAIIGGETGAEVGAALYTGFVLLPYSRENETQADILGSRILADAGYDPRDLANMFKTIEKESGGGGPSWLSTHPSPNKRFETINREASMLEVDQDPIKVTPEFSQTQQLLRSYPRAKTLAEIEKDKNPGKNPPNNDNHTQGGGGEYRARVDGPSVAMRQINNGNWINLSVPRNWRDFTSDQLIEFAPEGAHGSQGITHGMMIGVYRGNSSDLYGNTQEYADGLLRANTYLRVSSSYSRYTLGGQQGYTVSMSGTSPITRRTELVTLYTTTLRNGDLFYAITVVPENEYRDYSNTFRQVLNSIRLYY